MNETIYAKSAFPYRHRMLSAGQPFEATPIDAAYLVKNKKAQREPLAVTDKPKPVAEKKTAAPEPVVEPVAPVVPALSSESEVKDESVAEAPVEDVKVDEAAPQDVVPAPESEAEAPAVGSPVAPLGIGEQVVTRRPYTRRGAGSRS